MAHKSTISGNLALLILVVVAVVSISIWTTVTRTGEIHGVVVDTTGQSVAGAAVRLREKTLNLVKEGITVYTDQAGRFTFTNQAIIEFLIDAESPDGRRSQEVRMHLYFPGQDFTLPQPLVVAPTAAE